MALFPYSVFFVFVLPSVLVSSFSDKQKDKLDEIKELLHRLEKEVDRMRSEAAYHGHGQVSRNDTALVDEALNDTSDNLTENKTGYQDFTVTGSVTESSANISETQINFGELETTAFDVTTAHLNNSDNNNSNSDIDLDFSRTTGDLQTQFQKTEEPNSLLTDHTSSMVTKKHDGSSNEEDEDKKNEENDKDKENDNEENELQDVERVKHLIDEGEDLERQLKGVFHRLRSLNECVPTGDKCGIRESLSKCCKGLKCTAIWSGTCYLDCVSAGESCSQNFFCCPGYQCVKSKENGMVNYKCLRV